MPRAVAVAALILAAAVPAATAGGRSRTDAATLLARYEPVLQLYAADRTPSAIEPFLGGADLERLTAGRWRIVRSSPPPEALANGSKQLRLDTRGCSPAVNLDSCYSRATATPTVYGRVWVSPTASAGIGTVLQYWFFYTIDDWRSSPTRPTLWHMHEGDWEEVALALDASDRPLQVAASQHNLGVVRPWARVRRSGGTHPLIYVALGSHANYFTPGLRGVPGAPHVIPPSFSGVPLPEPDFTSSQVTVRSAAVVDLSSGTAPWLSFAGAWGDGSYLVIRQSTGKYTHLRVGDSPIGPAFHSAWRDPLQAFRSWPPDDGH